MWVKISDKLDQLVLMLIRAVNIVLFASIVIFLGKKITGIDVQSLLVGLGIFLAAVNKSNVDIASLISKKIVSLSWGPSLILFGLFSAFIFSGKSQLCLDIKNLLQKNVRKN